MQGRAWALGLLLILSGMQTRAEAPVGHEAVTTTKHEAATRVSALHQRLAAAAQHFKDEAMAEAESGLAAVIGDPGFAQLEPALQQAALMMGGFSAMSMGKPEHARDRFAAAIPLDPDESESRIWLFALEADLGNTEAAAAHLIRVAKHWPERLDALEPGAIGHFVYGMNGAAALRLEVLQALFDSEWTHSGLGASDLWYELAVMRIDRGEVDAARAAVSRIARPLELIKLISDKRFDPIVDPHAAEFDIKRAAQRNVDDLRVLALLNPTRLDVEMELGYAMLMAGMHEEVIAAADGILAAIEQSSPDGEAFEDLEQKIWILNNRSIALRMLGRNNDAIAALERASKLSEDGQTNVSQALNLGTLYCELNRPDEALAAIGLLGEMSGYGRMVQARIQQCAALLTGDRATADRALTYLREHKADSASILLKALLHQGRMDEAAGLLIDQLTSRKSRGEMLLSIQQFEETPPLPGRVELDARRQELLARPDVRASIAKVGRVGRFELYPLSSGW